MPQDDFSAVNITTKILKKRLKTGVSSLKRLGHTAKTVTTSGLRVATGEPLDAILVRETFEQLGSTYIKLAQFVASSPSLFPRDYVEEFQKCLDQTSPLPFSYIEKVLEEELGDKLLSEVASIERKPLASASIAQVHAAKLVSGQNIVFKVQKPDVATIINTDLSVVLASMKFAELVMPKLKFASLSQIVDEIKQRMVEEADFTKEAQNIAEFQQFLQLSQNTRVVAPKVYESLSTKKVLTMERFYGVPMTDPKTMKQYCDSPAEVLTTTLNTWFSSLMMCNNFHADLHAGNLMLLKDGRIGFIDFGIVGKLKAESWQSAIGFTQALQEKNIHDMAKCMLGMGMTDRKVNIDHLANDLTKLMKVVMETDANLGVSNQSLKNDAEELNRVMLDLVQIGKRHGIHFPRDFTLLLKQLLYFDRFMQIIAPNMDMFNDVNVQLLGSVTDE